MSATMNPLLLNTILYHLTSAKRRLFAPLLFIYFEPILHGYPHLFTFMVLPLVLFTFIVLRLGRLSRAASRPSLVTTCRCVISLFPLSHLRDQSHFLVGRARERPDRRR